MNLINLDPDKNMALVFVIHGRTLNLHITTINLKYLLILGMMNLFV